MRIPPESALQEMRRYRANKSDSGIKSEVVEEEEEEGSTDTNPKLRRTARTKGPTSGLLRFCRICLSVSLVAKKRVQPLFRY